MLIFFLRDIHEGHLSLEDVGDEQNNFDVKIKNLDLKKSFFTILGQLVRAREKVFNNFKRRSIPIRKLDKTP